MAGERNLKLSSPYMSGEDVKTVQGHLTSLGYSPGTIDGIFGAKTDAAVKAFQKDKGLTIDGIVGSKTRAALAASVSAPAEPSAPAPTNLQASFLSFLESQLGQIYVIGGYGENLTSMSNPEAWIKTKETDTGNADRAIALYRTRVKQGMKPIYAYDCSGLISRWLMNNGYAEKKRNCNHLANDYCIKVYDKVPTAADLRPGDLVFRWSNSSKYYHVGVYVGGGMVIESKGRDDGVVMRILTASGSNYWNRYGRMKVLGG